MSSSLKAFLILSEWNHTISQCNLKEVAIIQLGYSRGGISAHLPDDILKYIKSFVFYDISNDLMYSTCLMRFVSKRTCVKSFLL